jgi:TldD protein
MKRDDFLSLLTEGREILAAASCDFADARLESVRTVRCALNGDGRTERRDRSRLGLGLRVRLQGRWGFAAVEGDVQWAETLARAQALAGALPSCEVLPFAEAVPLEAVETAHQDILPIDAERLRELFERAKQAVPGAKNVRLRAMLDTGWRGVVNSEGTRAARPIARSSLALTVSVQSQDGRSIPVPLASAASAPRDLVADLLGQLDAAQALAGRLSSALPVQARQCPVVLSPACAAYLIHEAFGHLCEADRVPPDRKETLPIGLALGPTDLEIWDRSDVPGASGSLCFDDEGVRCQPAALVSGGRWNGLLHSRATAGIFGTCPTGNARVTSFRFTPLCRMRVTELRPGSHDPGDIIAAVSDGLYLEVPYGGHVRGPRFHLTAVDVRHIRAGKLAETYAGAVLVGEPLAILREIEAIGHDQKLIDGLGNCSREDQKDLPVSMMAPSIRLRQAYIAPF